MKYQTRQNDYYNVSLQPVWKCAWDTLVGHVTEEAGLYRTCQYWSMTTTYQIRLNNCYTVSVQPVETMCVGHVGGTREAGVYCTTCQFCGMSTTYQTRLDNYSYYTVSMRPVWKICVGHVRGTRWWDTKHDKNHDMEHVHDMYHHDSDWQIDFMIQCVHYV